MSVKVKAILRKVTKYSVIAYVGIATLVGTSVMAWPFVVLMWNGLFSPAPLPVYLPNGFIYKSDWDTPHVDHIITDRNEKKMIIADVRDIMWHKNTIYGYRRGLAKEPYYYICTYGDDCSDTQHLTETDFIYMLKNRGLPTYDSRIAQTYDQLLWEQSKTDIGKKGG